MKIFKALTSGFSRTIKTWKGILIIWLGSLITVSLIAIPLRGFLNSAFGGSMITERLQDGLDIEVLGDLGSGFGNMLASFPAMLLLLVLIGFLLNAFLAGGVFDRLRGTSSGFSGSEFFRACAKNFWSYLIIALIISVILIALIFIIIAVPASLVSGSASEKLPFIITVLAIIVFLLISMIFMLVADYARAWQAAQPEQACFKALGFGFTRTFDTFFFSFPLMLILFIIQIFFVFLVIFIIGRWKPVTGGGVLLLFICSQILFYIRSGLRVWRYGSVTALMENTELKKPAIVTIP